MNEQTQTQPVSQALTRHEGSGLGFFEPSQFVHLQRLAKMFSSSELVPKNFQGEQNIPNVVIALEMAQRMGAGCLAVMQSIYIVYGKPGWASTFIIACLNTCGRFEPLMFDITGTGDGRQCIAWTVRKGVRLPAEVGTLKDAKDAGLVVFEGPACSIDLAKKEGWFSKNGSKWQTMPELMLRYRAATWFGRLYAPELLMGMSAVDEITDTIDVTPAPAMRVLEKEKQKSESIAVDGSKSAKETKPEPADEVPGLEPAASGPVETELQKSLRLELERNGVQFDDFCNYLSQHVGIRDADSWGSPADVPDAIIKAEVQRSLPKIVKIYGTKGGAK